MVRTIQHICFPLLIIMLVAGCTSATPATSRERNVTENTAPGESAPQTPSLRAPSMGGPLPAERVPSPVKLDTSCQVDADCAVKDVGNCCGAMPACVHKDSPTDPAAVQAECARRGLASVCGFREISACTCSDGRCRDASGAGVAR